MPCLRWLGRFCSRKLGVIKSRKICFDPGVLSVDFGRFVEFFFFFLIVGHKYAIVLVLVSAKKDSNSI